MVKLSKNNEGQSKLANYFTNFFTFILTMYILKKMGAEYSVFTDAFDLVSFLIVMVTFSVVFIPFYIFFKWLFPVVKQDK